MAKGMPDVMVDGSTVTVVLSLNHASQLALAMRMLRQEAVRRHRLLPVSMVWLASELDRTVPAQERPATDNSIEESRTLRQQRKQVLWDMYMAECEAEGTQPAWPKEQT